MLEIQAALRISRLESANPQHAFNSYLQKPEKLKILLVNDDRNSLLVLTSILIDENATIPWVAVTSGKDALREVLTNELAVIFLAANMPRMDG